MSGPGQSLSAIFNLQRIIIYPNYIDSKKTVAEGRRIPKDKGDAFVRLLKEDADIRRETHVLCSIK